MNHAESHEPNSAELELVSSLLHQILGPLTGARSSTALALHMLSSEKLDSKQTKDVKKSVERVKLELLWITGVVENFRVFATLKRQDVSTLEKRILAGPVFALEIRDVGDTLLELAPQRKSIRYDLSRLHRAKIKTTRGLAEAAVRAVLDNALRYSFQDSTVAVKAAKPSEQLIRISISNHGLPFSEKEIREATSAYSRGETPKMVAPSGLGLGLFIADRAMHVLGGKLRIESRKIRENESQTEVKLFFPLAEDME